ncbi:hypothetical protein NDU88_006440 [Pleurodeles waltl]|uniref:Uncharacterized protein n=1 Tax=Pleurodeles waltl TaxID=8319 RepID=A0AAV7NQ79_PLEWA|nr:hypothetical protein NDU88_006440 [Pleurodeles waltl]
MAGLRSTPLHSRLCTHQAPVFNLGFQHPQRAPPVAAFVLRLLQPLGSSEVTAYAAVAILLSEPSHQTFEGFTENRLYGVEIFRDKPPLLLADLREGSRCSAFKTVCSVNYKCLPVPDPSPGAPC